jgi:hypothetical protein
MSFMEMMQDAFSTVASERLLRADSVQTACVSHRARIRRIMRMESEADHWPLFSVRPTFAYTSK